jgi:hypothetical protein
MGAFSEGIPRWRRILLGGKFVEDSQPLTGGCFPAKFTQLLFGSHQLGLENHAPRAARVIDEYRRIRHNHVTCEAIAVD